MLLHQFFKDDKPHIVYGINIEELQTDTYPAPHTGTTMFSVIMTVGIHADVHIPALRGNFLDYCDDLNLDATFEPARV